MKDKIKDLEKLAIKKEIPDKKMTSINIGSLNCIIGNKTILSDIKFAANKSKIIVITGPNGIGKSTLLKTILGLLPIVKGNITINDRDCTNDPEGRKEKLNFIGHKNALNENFTIFENLRYWQNFFSSEKTDIYTLMDFWDLPNIKLGTCSEGQKKKTALARLSIIGRHIWLLDEPASNLDLLGQKKLVQIVKEHQIKGGISIISTHNPDLFKSKNVIELSNFAPKKKIYNV